MTEIMIALAIKHYLADYIFNPAFTVPVRKDIYGSRGSLEHIGMHMFWCVIALVCFLPFKVVILATLFDAIIHYHQDYFKTKWLYEREGLSDRVRRAITGADQLVHILTYIIIAAWVT
tara:strand:+ start:507 stop:860 length:354 start_codon:yes stop_codon:yes gene_type:complete